MRISIPDREGEAKTEHRLSNHEFFSEQLISLCERKRKRKRERAWGVWGKRCLHERVCCFQSRGRVKRQQDSKMYEIFVSREWEIWFPGIPHIWCFISCFCFFVKEYVKEYEQPNFSLINCEQMNVYDSICQIHREIVYKDMLQERSTERCSGQQTFRGDWEASDQTDRQTDEWGMRLSDLKSLLFIWHGGIFFYVTQQIQNSEVYIRFSVKVNSWIYIIQPPKIIEIVTTFSYFFIQQSRVTLKAFHSWIWNVGIFGNIF